MIASARQRVLHVSQPTTEGVARCVADFARSQVAQGCEVLVACPLEGALADDVAAAGADVVRWQATRNPGPSVALETARLLSIVRRTRPTVVHLHSAKAGLAGRLAVHGAIPTVYQPHAWSFLAVAGAVRRATTQWERTAVRWTDMVVCVSQAELEQGIGAGVRVQGKSAVVPNGVDTRRFVPRPQQDARAELGLGSGPLAVCVGRLSRQKGQDVLLAAWTEVLASVPDAQLVLVGDGPERQALAGALPQGVRLVGRADPSPWYAAADVVVLPSRWEGMALVPLEAAASARSAVVTDVAGAREGMPAEAGDRIVPPECPSALAAVVTARLLDRALAAREGAAARRHVEAHHDVRTTAEQLTAAYDTAQRRRAAR